MGFSTVGARSAVARILAAACLVAGLLAIVRGQAGPPAPPPAAVHADAALQVATLLQGKLPIVAERRYRLAGKVLFLFFWKGKDDVGGARVRWRRGENGERGYDLLIGSDPTRAPRKTNRWGFIMEESLGNGATVLGVMKKSDEESLEQAEKSLASDAAGGVTFNLIQATVDPAASTARTTSAHVPRDYTYQELQALMEVLVAKAATPTVRKTAAPPGWRHGLLLSVAEMLQDGVEAVRRTSKPPVRKSLPYTFYKKQYDLTRVSSALERQATYGGVRYSRLLKSSFEIRARGESWVEKFGIVCGVDDAVAEIPVFISYQPRWWLKLEFVLDGRQVF